MFRHCVRQQTNCIGAVIERNDCVGNVRIAVAQQNGVIEITVADDGVRITAGQLKKSGDRWRGKKQEAKILH